MKTSPEAANVALPYIGESFDSSQTMLDLIAVAYSLGLAASVLWLGARRLVRAQADDRADTRTCLGTRPRSARQVGRSTHRNRNDRKEQVMADKPTDEIGGCER